MKVGITRTQLAGSLIDHLQAKSLFALLLITTLFPLKHWSQTTPVALPIKLVGKLPFVEATVNGITGHFLFDTGAEKLVLNSRYFNNADAIAVSTEIMGFDGEPIPSTLEWTESIRLGGLDLPNVNAMMLDLAPMEAVKKTPIHGIIGHDLIRGISWKMDLEGRVLTIGLASRYLTAGALGEPPADSFDLKFSGHLPYAFANLAGKRLRLALDTGSERNLLQSTVIPADQFSQRGKIKIAGLDKTATQLPAGYIPDFAIGLLLLDSLEVVLTDLQRMNHELRSRLDGILGNTFFIDHVFSIDYRRRKAYFWRKDLTLEVNELAVSLN